MRDPIGDEVTRQLDVRQLDDGDLVEVLVDDSIGWQVGRFTISSAGELVVRFSDSDSISFGAALGVGLRRPWAHCRAGRDKLPHPVRPRQ